MRESMEIISSRSSFNCLHGVSHICEYGCELDKLIIANSANGYQRCSPPKNIFTFYRYSVGLNKLPRIFPDRNVLLETVYRETVPEKEIRRAAFGMWVPHLNHTEKHSRKENEVKFRRVLHAISRLASKSDKILPLNSYRLRRSVGQVCHAFLVSYLAAVSGSWNW